MKIRLTGISSPIIGASWEYLDEKKETPGHSSGMLENQIEDSNDIPYNLDNDLNCQFMNAFRKKTDLESREISPLQQNLMQKKINNTIQKFVEYNDDTELGDEATIIKTLIPQEMRKEGKNFSIIDLPGEKTLVFGVYKYINHIKNTRSYILEPLKTEEKQVEGAVVRTYYIDDLQEDGNQIVTITLKSNVILINNGILIGDIVKLTRKPSALVIERDYSRREDEEDYFFPKGYYEDSLMLGERGFQQIFEDKERIVEVEANVGAKSLIIDTENQELVRREIIYDESEKRDKFVLKIKPKHYYFALQLIMQETKTTEVPLSNLELGRCYREGSWNYPKDVIKAIEYFQKEETPESQYEIFRLLFEEEEVKDEKVAMKYLEKSVNLGYPLAKVQLALLGIFKKDESVDVIALLNSAIKDELPVAKYLKAVLMELEFIKKNKDEMLSLYYEAASEGYKPAQYRMSATSLIWKWKEKFSNEVSEEYFWESQGKGEAEYCFGSTLLWGYGISHDINMGIEFLRRAIDKGNENAKKDLIKAIEMINPTPERSQTNNNRNLDSD